MESKNIVRAETLPARSSKASQRSVTSRVKSGCRTCKIRRVKCDEQRPACRKCLLTGRICDGYGIWGGGGNSYSDRARLIKPNVSRCFPPSPLTRGYNSLLISNADSEELICFDYFRQRTTLKMPGAFDSEFWETIVLQISSNEPAVFHAAIALASTQRGQELHECLRNAIEPCRDTELGQIINKWDRFALQQYNKAIADLQVHFVAQNHRSVQISLTTCMIFTCIELMRGSYTAANTHINNGIKLLRNLQQQSRTQLRTQSLPRNTVTRCPTPQSWDDDLLEAFARMNIQSILFGYQSRYLHVIVEDTRFKQYFHIPDKFGNLKEARQYLEILLNEVLHLNEESRSKDYASVDAGSLLNRRQELQTCLNSWLNIYETSVPTLIPALDIRTSIGLPLLRIYHIMTSIMLSTCPLPNAPRSEMVYDCHTHSFSSLLAKAYNLARYQDLPVPYKLDMARCRLGGLNFTADMGIIPPLYYTAIKCRIPGIRQQAINALLTSPHREGMWDGTTVATVAQLVTSLEEGDTYKSPSQPTKDGQTRPGISGETSFLPEAYRFEDVQVVMQDGTKNRGKVICRRRKRCGQAVRQFDNVSEGVYDEWEVIEESFQYESSNIH